MEEALVLAPVGRALSRARPDIRNSDQGSPFTDGDYVTLVTGAGARISMDGRGRALDNVFTERLWRSLKYEEVYLHEYDSPRSARAGVGAWLSSTTMSACTRRWATGHRRRFARSAERTRRRWPPTEVPGPTAMNVRPLRIKDRTMTTRQGGDGPREVA